MMFEDFLDMCSVFSEGATRDVKSSYAFRIYGPSSGARPTAGALARTRIYLTCHVRVPPPPLPRRARQGRAATHVHTSCACVWCACGRHALGRCAGACVMHLCGACRLRHGRLPGAGRPAADGGGARGEQQRVSRRRRAPLPSTPLNGGVKFISACLRPPRGTGPSSAWK